MGRERMNVFPDPEIYILKEKRSTKACHNEKTIRLTVITLHLVRTKLIEICVTLVIFSGGDKSSFKNDTENGSSVKQHPKVPKQRHHSIP